MTKRKYIEFNATTVPLKGSNLIEASAGTGKTYSIAILVLRLVLEQQIPVKDILMVTFTKAAVAELEARVRLFIRMAYNASLGKPVNDKNIKDLVNKAIADAGKKDIVKGKKIVQQALRNAVAYLDETSVLTIHSFCQQVLQEFAFETNQFFDAELITDSGPQLEAALNHFWRRYVTTLNAELLERICSSQMKWKMQKLVQEHLSGKNYLGFAPEEDYTITDAKQKKWLKELTKLEEKETSIKNNLHIYVKKHRTRLNTLCESNRYARNSLLSLIPTPAAFIDEVERKLYRDYVTKLFPDILKQINTCIQVREKQKALLLSIRHQLNCFAIKEIEKIMTRLKGGSNIIGFDDLIEKLHSALVKKNNPQLEEALQKKYKAVFVDEFQDTDRHQYEIFDKAFGRNTILFYIGDPKQSIYGWRKADIFTYFKARNKVKQVYSMNQNFRSSAPFIEALNRFFLPDEEFDTFYFSKQKDAIEYIPVESPRDNAKGILYKGTKPEVPLSIRLLPREEIAKVTAAQVAHLLRNKAWHIKNGKKQHSLLPSDIGVLVRTKRQGLEIKEALSLSGIPAIIVDDSMVLQSEEATYLLYLLEAVEDPDRSSVNRALLSPFTGYAIDDILRLDDEAVVTLFNKYKVRWVADGIYTALMDFMNDFGVRHVLLQSNTEEGERVITNFMQLAELLHQVENRKSLTTIEIITWLRRHIDGMATEGDEFIQRVETDEDAVKIVTIHKSKGLEYKIVLAPYLEFNTSARYEFVSFRDPATGEYVGAETERLTEEQFALQQQQDEQENRRLLYVALTRAIYKCYIFESEHGRSSTLSEFTGVLSAKPGRFINFESGSLKPPAGRYRVQKAPKVPKGVRPVRFSLLQPNWQRISYTMLAAKSTYKLKPHTVQENDAYDTFIYKTLRTGAKTGDLIHFLLENIDFANDKTWEKWILDSVQRYAPALQKLYLPMLRRLIQEVLNARIQTDDADFTLSAIPANRRINEFEFDFPVSLFRPSDLNAFSDTPILVKDFPRQLEGIMNGKMDLFFEHAGRYYILDWKSNHLGADPENYATPSLAEAMRENNYHLQYLLYTLAAKKYLNSRLPDFNYTKQFGGVIYFFVRGARANSKNGIFMVKPAIETINELETIINGDIFASANGAYR